MLSAIALAIRYISSSLPSRFKEFTAHITNRQLSFKYPMDGLILSMLGQKFRRLYPERCSGEAKGRLLTSHLPVHLATAHSLSRSWSRPLRRALPFVLSSRVAHG